jgi:glucosamine--fructose-6-phosphate aminotransferase (isomerizing)
VCGIIGYVGRAAATEEVLLSGLSNLEYRGYDSAGIAVSNGEVEVLKREGELSELERAVEARGESFDANVGIGHTRWSTHGPPSDANSHPHTDESGSVAVVHNGIIENYQSLRDELAASGVEFTSETDSEVVPHLMAGYLEDGLEPELAFRRAVDRLEGSYALAAIVEGTDAVFAAREDSPLVLGVGEAAYYLASDVPAFLEYTRDVVYLDDGEFATLRPDGWAVADSLGEPVAKEVSTVTWSAEQTGKSGYDHFMLKEIHEQPNALRQALSGRIDQFTGEVTLEELGAADAPEHVQLVACGTSYHAALYGAHLFREAGVPANAYLANEYALKPAPIAEETLVIGVTQSGETADTLAALRQATSRGVETLAVTNVVGSTAARECDHAMFIRAGPEIGVAATKTFSSQLVALNLLVEQLVANPYRGRRTRDFLEALRSLPDQVQTVLDESRAAELASGLVGRDAYFFIGRGLNHPVALEGALKFKEITYEHAAGLAAGELKHGTLALVTDDTPVFAVVNGTGENARKTIGNVKEVQARGAPVVAVTDGASSR